MDRGEYSVAGRAFTANTHSDCVNMSRVINSRVVLCSDLLVRILYVHPPSPAPPAPARPPYVHTELRLRRWLRRARRLF